MENNDFFKAILELIREILAEIRDWRANPLIAKNNSNPLEDLIDSVDVKSILEISESTLYRIKQSKLIHTVRIGKRDYYSRTEIQNLVNKFMK